LNLGFRRHKRAAGEKRQKVKRQRKITPTERKCDEIIDLLQRILQVSENIEEAMNSAGDG